MRIVHFSDIHAAPRLQLPRALFDKRLLGFFNFYCRRSYKQHWGWVGSFVEQLAELEPQLVVCTGDITSIASPGEFEQAVDALRPLVDNHGWDFVYIPGNHDAYVSCTESAKALEHAFETLNRGRWRLGDLPVLHAVGPLRLLLLNQATPAPLYASYGAVDPAAVDWLESHLPELRDPAAPLVLVNHFPLFDAGHRELSWRRACRGIAPLQQALLDNTVQVALCGHIHHRFIRREASGSMEVCSGSMTQNGSVSCLDYDPETHQFSHSWHQLQASFRAYPKKS